MKTLKEIRKQFRQDKKQKNSAQWHAMIYGKRRKIKHLGHTYVEFYGIERGIHRAYLDFARDFERTE